MIFSFRKRAAKPKPRILIIDGAGEPAPAKHGFLERRCIIRAARKMARRGNWDMTVLLTDYDHQRKNGGTQAALDYLIDEMGARI